MFYIYIYQNKYNLNIFYVFINYTILYNIKNLKIKKYVQIFKIS